MSKFKQISDILDKLQEDYPVGFAIALHVTYTAPKFLFQTYSADWMEEYSRRGLIMHDPTVKWGLANDGWVRWSDLADLDETGVLPAAREHGLVFGVTTATTDQGTKSLASFATDVREFDDEEAAALAATTALLHALTVDGVLDPEEERRLRKLSVSSTHATARR